MSASAPSGVASLAALADLLGQRLDPGPDLVPAGAHGPLAGVGLEQLVDRRCRVPAAPGQPGAHGVGVGTEQAQVEHGCRR